MHFWINKGATSFQYGRRRPNFYSSGVFGSSNFGRERSNLGGGFRSSARDGQSSSASSSQSNNRQSYSSNNNNISYINNSGQARLSPYYAQNSSADEGSNRRSRSNSRSPRRHYEPEISDPSIQEALDELQQEIQASFESPSSRRSSENGACIKTKYLGLTLCFLGFILLSTVAARFFIEGPSIIDANLSRKGVSKSNATAGGGASTVSFFFFSEIIFVAFAMGLFLTGVACLKKRTNEYLLSQFRQHIINSSSGGPGGLISDDEGGESVSPLHPSPCLTRTEGERASAQSARPSSRSQPYSNRYLSIGPPGRSRRMHSTYQLSKQKPPPYDVALYLPLPNIENSQEGDTSENSILGGGGGRESASKFSEEEEDLGNEIKKDEGENGGEDESFIETPPPSYEEQFSLQI